MLKQVEIEITDATGKIGNHWEQGTTTVMLYPNVPPETGNWKSDRPGDIDSGGGVSGTQPTGPKRKYDFSTTRRTLFLRTYSDDIKKKGGKDYLRGEPVTTVLSLEEFNLDTPFSSSGQGIFPFKGKNLPVEWEVNSTTEVKMRDPDPPKDKVILGRRYRLEPNDPVLIKRTTSGFQEYEYFDEHQELLYVGRSGGKDGIKINDWVKRLHHDHIKTEWIGEAKTVVVTYGLTLQEAMALEEIQIPSAKYNRKPGDHSSASPEGSTSENALSASKHGFRETYRIVILPPK
jgi:hypothetical protein